MSDRNSTFQRLFFASPQHQFKRVCYAIQIAKEAILGRPARFPDIHMEEHGDLYLGRCDDGFEWCVPSNDPSLVSWARLFISKRLRFEDENLLRPCDLVVNVGACTGEYTSPAASSVAEQGEVIALEPDPDHFACLSANMELRGA